MKHVRPLRAVLAATAVSAALLASPAAQGAPQSDGAQASTEKAPSFAAFAATAHRDRDGAWIVNGDEALRSRTALRSYYDRMVAAGPAHQESATAHGGTDVHQQAPQQGLIINTTAYGDDRWSSTTARNLTYCVSNNFGTSKTTVVNAMAQGAALWERQSTGVNFTYVSSADANCRTSNNAVLFSVEPTTSTQYIARAFFPSTSDAGRNVLVNARSLVSSGWAPANIMGHELGHTLGFRHEHTRPEAGTCFEDNNWRALTTYDSASIMHYPQCNGTSTSLSFSTRDGSGLRAVYGG